MTADIAYLPPPKPKRCFDCSHSTSGPNGTHCWLYSEKILVDSTAEDCEQFDG